tara:strand:- start:369 stop:593 length:225 start_codon:yes stop_codon:yes gene_type:complete
MGAEIQEPSELMILNQKAIEAIEAIEAIDRLGDPGLKVRLAQGQIQEEDLLDVDKKVLLDVQTGKRGSNSWMVN